MASQTNPEPARLVDSKKVWTTLITNLSYLPGLLTLDSSLKAQKSAYPLLALYTPSLPPPPTPPSTRATSPKS
ncbi:MAG: glycosyltransferase family 8 [Lasallia pustulata]|uniref:Glycosyltransferase family 8 n=1 Tax=Lasallia pustulata TaxID=136370 RepID=A0A5M8PCR5_9LECA|nr:MAG: glycosyltransferase family 8 [Lasallia pustulata]